ncbi:MAG TPA: hypothetical protein VMF35_18375 [Acidimicrobiales bacterium]|nr:hypothetical protein [Acidimicrobiales bacterium]
MPDVDPERLLTTAEAAHLLGLEDRSLILDWISRDCVPYVKLPGDARRAWYRVPRLALLSMLGGDNTLSAEFKAAFASAATRQGEPHRPSQST